MKVVKCDSLAETLSVLHIRKEGSKDRNLQRHNLNLDLDPHQFFLRKRLCFENNSKGHKYLEAIIGIF